MAGLALSRRLGPASRLVHSSLLEACGTRGRAPYEAVLTHGFVLDETGPQDVEIARQRRRAAGRDEAERRRHPAALGGRLGLFRGSAHRPRDPEASGRRLSPAAQHAALSAGRARRVRRRPRAVAPRQMPELERWVLHRLAELDALVRQSIAEYDFHAMFTALHNFCAVDLSAFYFDIRKDRLYCDCARRYRRGARRARCWTAPSTAWCAGWRRSCASPPRRPGSRAMATRRGAASISNSFAEVPRELARSGAGRALGAAARSAPRRHRRARGRARRQAHRLEPAGGGRGLRARAPRRLGSRGRSRRAVHHLGRYCVRRTAARGSLQPARCPRDRRRRLGRRGERCERCWRVLPEVGDVPGHADLCRRCAEVIDRRGVVLA